MKKARSSRPAYARMQQRLQKCFALPVEQRADFYYCDGQSISVFCAAVEAGQSSAVALALDVLTAAQWLRPRDMASYGGRLRSALYTACEAGLLKGNSKRSFFDAEYRLLVELMKRAWHLVPGAVGQRAQRRLAEVLPRMRQHFGAFPEYVDIDDWPVVPAPVQQLRRAVRKGWFTDKQAAELAASSMNMLMQILHGCEDELPAFSEVSSVTHAAETPCYFFYERAEDDAVWVVAPLRELRDLYGIILATDASFCYVMDDWGGVHGCK